MLLENKLLDQEGQQNAKGMLFTRSTQLDKRKQVWEDIQRSEESRINRTAIAASFK